MAIFELKPFFADHHQGQAPYLHILNHAIAPVRDVAISDDNREALADALKKSARHQNVVTIFNGANLLQKSMQINQLSYQSGQAVCLIDCALMTEKYIGETEKNIAKLIADAENKNWILFFDEADALLASIKPINISGILKHISHYQGISVLNIKQKQHLSKLAFMTDCVINFSHF